MMKLSEYDNTLVRVLRRDGNAFTGRCEWNPPDHDRAPADRGEESLKVGGTVIPAGEIEDVELLRHEVCIPLRDWPEAKEEAAAWFHERWNVPLEAYRGSIGECIERKGAVPQWYVVVRGNRIIAGCGVIENDFHERTDLAPNVCAVFVDREYRDQGIAGFLLRYVCEDMADLGVGTLYLLTDHIGFYERYGWQFLCMARETGGEWSRIYVHYT